MSIELIVRPSGAVCKADLRKKLDTVDCIYYVSEATWQQRVWTRGLLLQRPVALTNDGVVQEFALAKRRNFQWGDFSMDWAPIEQRYLPTTTSVVENDVPLDHNLALLLETFLIQNTALKSQMRTGPKIGASDLLLQTKSLLCSNPKDRVFALYEMLRLSGVSLPDPDYSKSITQIYVETSRTVMEAENSLRLLDTAGTCPDSCPSWTANLEPSLKTVPEKDLGQRFESMSLPSWALSPSLSFKGQTLRLKGFQRTARVVDCIRVPMFPDSPEWDLKNAICPTRDWATKIEQEGYSGPGCGEYICRDEWHEVWREGDRCKIIQSHLDYLQALRLLLQKGVEIQGQYSSDDLVCTIANWTQKPKVKRAGRQRIHERFAWSITKNIIQLLLDYRTMKHGHLGEWNSGLRNGLEHFEKIFLNHPAWPFLFFIALEEWWRAWTEIGLAYQGLSFYITEGNVGGLAWNSPKVGDILAVMPGKNRAVVLRPQEEGTFRFVSTAVERTDRNWHTFCQASLKQSLSANDTRDFFVV
jgi:hypothetical protein